MKYRLSANEIINILNFSLYNSVPKEAV